MLLRAIFTARGKIGGPLSLLQLLTQREDLYPAFFSHFSFFERTIEMKVFTEFGSAFPVFKRFTHLLG